MIPLANAPHSRLRPLAPAVLVVLFALGCGTTATAGDAERPFLSPLVGDHVVLQCEIPNRLWGWSEPGREIRVAVGEHAASAVAAADGRWVVQFQPPPVGGP